MRKQATTFTKVEEEEEEEEEQCSSSSIGKNSDVSSETDSGDTENEAQSAFKYNGPLDMMDSLQQVLPIRRGISKFYEGKSKSFTSLGEIASSSPTVREIGKPDTAYTRRRRNLMAVNHVWEKNRSFPLRGGISKRTTMSSSRSALALAFAVNYDSSSSSSSCMSEESNPVSPPPPLPPLYPRSNVSSVASSGRLSSYSPVHQNFSAWRSFSLVDLQNCATAATIKMPSSSLRNEAAHLS